MLLRDEGGLAGEDAVKGAGEKYLPRLDSQSDEEYVSYRKRTAFFNATARTLEEYLDLVQAIQRKIFGTVASRCSCLVPVPRSVAAHPQWLSTRLHGALRLYRTLQLLPALPLAP